MLFCLRVYLLDGGVIPRLIDVPSQLDDIADDVEAFLVARESHNRGARMRVEPLFRAKSVEWTGPDDYGVQYYWHVHDYFTEVEGSIGKEVTYNVWDYDQRKMKRTTKRYKAVASVWDALPQRIFEFLWAAAKQYEAEKAPYLFPELPLFWDTAKNRWPNMPEWVPPTPLPVRDVL